MPDDYNYPRIVARKEFEAAKLLLQEKPFSHRVRSTEYFNKGKIVFGEDVTMPKKAVRISTAPVMMQEVAFKPARPARSGFKCTFENFPVYMPDPLKFTQRIRLVEGEGDQRRSFRSPT
jgi:hypothetical protein